MPRKVIIHAETEFLRDVTSFDLFFKHKDYQGGYGFECDEEGNIDLDNLNPDARENARKCLAGEMPNHLPGTIRQWHNLIRFCDCGSGEIPYDLNDARGIYAGKACSQCEAEKKSHFRPEIFTNTRYHADEPIETED